MWLTQLLCRSEGLNFEQEGLEKILQILIVRFGQFIPLCATLSKFFNDVSYVFGIAIPIAKEQSQKHIECYDGEPPL